MNQPTAKHREEAREIVRSQILQWHTAGNVEPSPLDVHRVINTESLTTRIASALSSRDAEIERLRGWQEGLAGTTVAWSEQRLSCNAEIREVLEGLASKHYVSLGEYCWCRAPGTATKPAGDYHGDACLAARGLWNAVQGGD